MPRNKFLVKATGTAESEEGEKAWDWVGIFKGHKTLEELFPLVHKNLEKHVFNGSLLFKWKFCKKRKIIKRYI